MRSLWPTGWVNRGRRLRGKRHADLQAGRVNRYGYFMDVNGTFEARERSR